DASDILNDKLSTKDIYKPPLLEMVQRYAFDTVVDVGLFDGALGVISAISALKMLNVTKRLRHLKHPVEVITFCDEEGVRFQSTFLGSTAKAEGFVGPVMGHLNGSQEDSEGARKESVRTNTNSGNKDKCLEDQLLDAKMSVEKAKNEMDQF
ncbi:allantoate deiminase 2, partial [Tanacetum coccineum]